MEFRREVLPSYGSSVPLSPDEIPQKPPTPLTQKTISFDVSEISQISNISSESTNNLGTTNYRLLNTANIRQSTIRIPQYQSTPLNAVALTDQTILKEMPNLKLPQRNTGPIMAPSHCASVTEVDKSSKLEVAQFADLSVPVFWECLKRQEEKVNTLQEQISRLLELKVPCQPDPKSALVPNNDPNESERNVLNKTSFSCPSNSFGGEYKENSELLSHLQAQSEKIHELQEQNQKLLEQNIKLLEEKQELQMWNHELKRKLLLKSDRKSTRKSNEKASPSLPNEDSFLIDNGTRRASLEKINEQDSANQQRTEAKRVYHSPKAKSNDVGGVQFREEKGIEKTSTSTMTSMIFDGSDKIVYQKLTTVTTDFKKQYNEVSAQCSPLKDPKVTPGNRHSTRDHKVTPENRSIRDHKTTPENRHSMKDHKVTPENQPSTKDGGSSSRRKKGKCRKCGKCSPLHVSGNAKSPRVDCLDTSKRVCRKTSLESGEETRVDALQNCEEKIEGHYGNQERIAIPRYENILRNVNELNLNCNEVETTPKVKTFLKPSSKERKKYTSPHRPLELLPTMENRHHSNRRQSSSTISNTSIDSVSSNCSIREIPATETESDSNIPAAATISIYGLSSPNLSKATRRYLENFGLVRDRSEDSLKSNRTTPVKRYIR